MNSHQSSENKVSTIFKLSKRSLRKHFPLSAERNSNLTRCQSSDHWRPETVWYRHGHTGEALYFLDNRSPEDQPQTCARGGRCPHCLGRQPGGGRCAPGCHGCWGHILSLGASWQKAGLHQCRPAAEARWSATSHWWRHRTCPSGCQKIPAYLKRGKLH